MKRWIALDNDEQAFTVAAALRFWARADNRDEFPEYDIATSAGLVEPIDPDACDQIADNLLQGGQDPMIERLVRFIDEYAEIMASDEHFPGSDAVDALVSLYNDIDHLSGGGLRKAAQ